MATYALPYPKIGETHRGNSYAPPVKVPEPKTNEEAWVVKSKAPKTVWASYTTTAASAADTAKEWLNHPANKMQVLTHFGTCDTDGDGFTSRSEFTSLLKAAGLGALADGKGANDAQLLFDKMDKDGDGKLDEEEIKALGQDSDGRAARRGLA